MLHGHSGGHLIISHVRLNDARLFGIIIGMGATKIAVIETKGDETNMESRRNVFHYVDPFEALLIPIFVCSEVRCAVLRLDK